ncbi:MAG: peptidoglycan DD-metalloendopeptidase family protein [Patescibacteria group bacterium]
MKLCFFIILIITTLLWPTLSLQSQTVEELNNQIQANQKKLEELQKKIDDYKEVIATKQAEVNSLKKQLLVLDDKMAQLELDIEANELNIATVNLEISSIGLEIEAKDKNIEDVKNKVAEVIRQLYISDQHSLLEIIILNNSLSDFFDQLNYLSELQNTLQANVNHLQTLKAELELKQQDLSNNKIKLLDIKQSLETSQSLLEATKQSKTYLIQQTRQSESRYQDLLAESATEQSEADSEIKQLEAELRRKLQQQGPDAIDQLNDTNFIWPVNPARGITAYFHDPTYPYRRYFEHPAIDIRAAQGFSIKAAASGIVGRAKDAAFGYSYVLLVHANGFSTVYGHVSRIDVVEGNFVTKGQIIGAVGGTPGTSGAGRLTTGPHLHFEIRYNGLPVDPLDHLP